MCVARTCGPQALVKQGKNIQAQESIRAALERAPENANAHANMGWSLSGTESTQKAMEHFREALRLEPEMEWARRGIVEAMKAHYFIYRWILNWFLWTAQIARTSPVWPGHRCLPGLHRAASCGSCQYPDLAPFINPLLIA